MDSVHVAGIPSPGATILSVVCLKAREGKEKNKGLYKGGMPFKPFVQLSKILN